MLHCLCIHVLPTANARLIISEPSVVKGTQHTHVSSYVDSRRERTNGLIPRNGISALTLVARLRLPPYLIVGLRHPLISRNKDQFLYKGQFVSRMLRHCGNGRHTLGIKASFASMFRILCFNSTC